MKNENDSELCDVKKEINERINMNELKCFGHLEMMDESRLV